MIYGTTQHICATIIGINDGIIKAQHQENILVDGNNISVVYQTERSNLDGKMVSLLQ